MYRYADNVQSIVYQVTELINASQYSSLVDYNFSEVTKNSASVQLSHFDLELRKPLPKLSVVEPELEPEPVERQLFAGGNVFFTLNFS
jgi:hypothetical protein